MTSAKPTGQLVRQELVLLRRVALARRLASARMPSLQRTGLVHGPFQRKTRPPLPTKPVPQAV